MEDKEKTTCQCWHNVKIDWEPDWEMGRTKEIPTYITLDGVRLRSEIVSYRREKRLQKELHRLYGAIIAQGIAIIILALTQLLR